MSGNISQGIWSCRSTPIGTTVPPIFLGVHEVTSAEAQQEGALIPVCQSVALADLRDRKSVV